MAHFKYIERLDVKAEKFLNFLKDQIISINEFPYNEEAGETPVLNRWEVFEEITEGDNISELILKRTVPDGEVGKVFYVKFINHTITEPTRYASFSVQVKENYDETEQTFETSGPTVLYQCADESIPNTERTNKHSIHVYMSIDNEKIAMVTVADPVVNFDDYRKSFLYVGSIEPFKYNEDDIDGNVLLTAGCIDAEIGTNELKAKGEYFGVHTSVGNNTLQMLGTKSGVRYQKHYPAFITPSPKKGNAYVDPVLGDTGINLVEQGFQASKWTDKYHLSPVYVVHPYEGYRGMMRDCIAVLNHNILHYDKLIVDVDPCKYPEKKWKQEVYRFFDIDTEQNFFKMSPNQGTAIAILSEVRY